MTKEQNELIVQMQLQFQKESLEELQAKFTKCTEDIDNFEMLLDGPKREILIKLFNAGLFKLNFQHAKFFRNIYEKIKSVTEPNTKLALSLFEVRSLQQVILTSHFTNPMEAIFIDDALTAIKADNERLHQLETINQILAMEIQRKTTEKKTGLDYSSEDNANVAKLGSRPDALVEAAKDLGEAVMVAEEDSVIEVAGDKATEDTE